jgi:hypothetical protein
MRTPWHEEKYYGVVLVMTKFQIPRHDQVKRRPESTIPEIRIAHHLPTRPSGLDGVSRCDAGTRFTIYVYGE